MKKITSDCSGEDAALVNFLKTHSPSPPPEDKLCEELLMRTIAQESNQLHGSKNSRSSKSFKFFWLLPLTIFSGFAIFSGYLFKQKLVPQIVAGYEDMETFMIDSWQGSMAQEPEDEEYIYTTVTSEY